MKRTSIFDKSLKAKKEVSESAFHLLFSEIVQHCVSKDKTNLEKQLEEIGYPLGARFLELVCLRDKNCKKETGIVNMLVFIKNNIWPVIFNKQVSSIEQDSTLQHIYMIKEENSLCNRYACLPRGQRSVNCSAFTAGIVEGIFNAAGFACRVCAIQDTEETKTESTPERTTYLIYFAPEVVERDLANKS